MKAHVYFPFQYELIAEADRKRSYFQATQCQRYVENTLQGRTSLEQENVYFNHIAILFWIVTTMQSSAKVHRIVLEYNFFV